MAETIRFDTEEHVPCPGKYTSFTFYAAIVIVNTKESRERPYIEEDKFEAENESLHLYIFNHILGRFL